MNNIKDIQLKSQQKGSMMIDILDEYCEAVDAVPTEEAKRYFRSMNGKVDPKLVRQCIFAGIYWATQHPEDVVVLTQSVLPEGEEHGRD